MPRIFLSYRRSDAGPYAGRLYDRLAARFGPDQVFMDVDSMTPGDDFLRTIEDRIAAADLLLVLIGRDWAGITDEQGRRRLTMQHDLVRHEILSAFKHGKAVIPVLVGRATMPSKDDLPPELSVLATRHALEVDDDSFSRDVDYLIGVLEGSPHKRRKWPATAIAAALAIVFLAAGMWAWFLSRGPEIGR